MTLALPPAGSRAVLAAPSARPSRARRFVAGVAAAATLAASGIIGVIAAAPASAAASNPGDSCTGFSVPSSAVPLAGLRTYCVVPAGIGQYTYEIEGGDGSGGTGFAPGAAGRGARIIGTIPVTPGQTLWIMLGGEGSSGGGGGLSSIAKGTTYDDSPFVIAGGGGGGGVGAGNGYPGVSGGNANAGSTAGAGAGGSGAVAGGDGGSANVAGAGGSPNGRAGGAAGALGSIWHSGDDSGGGSGGSGFLLGAEKANATNGYGGGSRGSASGSLSCGGGGGAGWAGGGGGSGTYTGGSSCGGGGGGGGSSLVPSGVTTKTYKWPNDPLTAGMIEFTNPVTVQPGPLTFAPTAFGTTAVGTPVTQTITVTNTGGLDAVLGAITPAGSGVVNTGGGTCGTSVTTIPAGGTCTVELTWTPTTSGALSSGGLTVAYTGGAGSSNTTLTGSTSPPTFTSVGPTSGSTGGGTPITIAGSGFATGATVTVGGTACTSVVVVSSTEITCITPAGTAGAANIVVTNPNSGGSTTQGTGVFTYGVPTVSALSPNNGPEPGGTLVTLTGTNFTPGMTVMLGTSACTLTLGSVNVAGTSATCTTTAGTGTVAATVTTGTVTSTPLANAFTYNPPVPATIGGVSPNTGSTLGGTVVTITGTNFASNLTAADVEIDGNACTSIQWVSATEITCTTPPGTAGAAVNVTVTNPGASVATAPGVFTYIPPTITAAIPGGGPVAGTNTVTLHGNNFGPGMAVTIGGNACTSVTVNPAGTEATCIAPASTLPGNGEGPVDVVVTDGTTPSTVTNGYTYVAAPTFGSISPASGPTTGGTVVTINGSGFVAGMTVTVGGNPCSPVTVISLTQLTCPTPPGTLGATDVVLTTPTGPPATAPNAFTYVAPPAPPAPSNGGGGSATPSAPPSAPWNVTVSPAPGQVVVAWNPPKTGGPFTHYVVTLGPGGASCTTTMTACTITGLAPGLYVANVVGYNAAGPGVSGTGSGVVPAELDPLLPLQKTTGGQSATTPAGVLPGGGLKAGGSQYLLNGAPTPVTIVPNKKAVKDASGLDVSADGWTMTLVGRGDTNDPLGLTDKAVLILWSEQIATRSGVTARMGDLAKAKIQPTAVSTGTGFMANSPVKFFILADTYMGTITTNADGTYNGQVPVPAGIKPGTYTLQVNGFAPSGQIRSLSIGVIVKSAGKAASRTASATVYFDVLSAVITPAGKATLDKLVRKTGTNGIKTVVIGFVQPTSIRDNDQTLSKARAQQVALYIKGKGVRGAFVVRGNGRAEQMNWQGRRVEVTVAYRK